MAEVIKIFSDGSTLVYDVGSFDSWCVYLTRPGSTRYAPKDIGYFDFFKDIGLKYGHQRVYGDFVKIFNITKNKIEQSVLNEISKIASGYGNDSLDVEIWFTVVYAGMVAEENKAFTRLGKRIKRLGMHQCLMQNYPADVAAVYSKGKPWRELDFIMTELGF